MKFLLVFFLAIIGLFFLSNYSWAATCTSTSTTTWSCGTPGSNDDLIVNHDITISGNFVVNNGSITVNSPYTLTIDGDLTFNNNSMVLVNVGATIYVTGNLLNKNNSGDVFIFGDLIIDGNFTNGTGSGNGAEIDVGGTGTITVGGICDNPGDVTNDDGTFTGCDNEILPIELVFFEGHHQNRVNILNWQTASEINNDFFELQRSQDAANWETLATIPGQGNSEVIVDYEYQDMRPLYGSNYYRLKQVDFDGRFEIFRIVLVKTGDLLDLAIESVYPNPTDGLLQINYQSNNTKPVLLNLINAQGESMIRSTIQNSPGLNHLELQLTDLASGIYILSLQNGACRSHQKIIKR